MPVLDKDNGTSNEYRQSSFATSSAKDGIEAKLSDEERRSALNFLSTCEDASQFISPHGKIDLVAILRRMEEMRRQKILDQHIYTINQLPDGRWQTYVPDESAKTGRKLVRRSSRSDVEDFIYEYYKSKVETHILDDVAYEWLERKRQEPGFKDSSYDRYENQYKRILGGLGTANIKNMSDVRLEDFLIKRIIEDKITQRTWRDMKTVLKGIFKYAKRHKYTKINIIEIIENIDEEKKLFAAPKRKRSKEEVFTDEEVKKIEEYIDGRTSISLVDLGIKLAFRTGLRAGELAALKYTDFDKEAKLININRTERHSKDETGHIKYYFSEEGLLKCDHESEELFLTSRAVFLLEQIHGLNPENDFLFCTDHFIRSQAFTKRLNCICKIIGITPRPLHKARKTYATRLINAKVDDSLVMSQLRHTDITTTRRFYYFDNRSAKEKSAAIENAMGQY